MTRIAVLGIEFGKNCCSIASLNEADQVALDRHVPQTAGLKRYLVKLPTRVMAPPGAAVRTTCSGPQTSAAGIAIIGRSCPRSLQRG